MQVSRRKFLGVLGGGLAASLRRSVEGAAARARRPNVVFILIDDMGWADVGCFGSTFFETPRIDGLAAEGMRFTNAYAACPVCSPTRASIMTGKYPARLQLTNYIDGRRKKPGSPILPADYKPYMEPSEVTIAEVLKAAGYATCHTGKWHMGGARQYLPENQGFDVNIAGSGAGAPRSYFWPQWKNNPPIDGRAEGEYLTDRLTDEACAFIEQHKDAPFFLYLAHYAVHIPIGARKDLLAKYEAKLQARPPSPGQQNNPHYAAMVESVDESVGRVLATLRRAGLDENTIVIFFSDNGGLSVKEGPLTPATTNAPLREGKGHLYEGGIREPMIVRWPGVTKAGGTCETPVVSTDFFPTLRDMAGLAAGEVGPNGPLDGVSLAPLLRDPGARLNRQAIFWHYPHFSNQGGMPGAAVRAGDWKLIEFYEFGDLELYNLKEDMSETNNLAPRMPEKTKELHAMLRRWREAVAANMPPPNPEYKKPEAAR